ncbi:MAG: hypothetical protein E6G47_07920 [Actinobacteria bacterium]|nr:MAG: hypothetical protein E6G47_07920 [Actinomycetota bacterium]
MSRWQQLGDRRQAGLGLAMLGRVNFFIGGETHEAEDCLLEAIRLLEPDGPSRELVRAHVWTLPLRYASGRATEGRAEATQAIRIDEALGGTVFRAQLDTSLGVMEAMGGDPSGADRVRAALASAEESGDVEAIARAHLNLVLSLYELSDNAEGIAAADAGRQAIRRFGTAAFGWAIAGTQAEMHVQLGAFKDAIDLATFVLSSDRARIIPAAIVWAGSAAARALLRLGRMEEAARTLEDVLAPARELGGTSFLARLLAVDAELQEAKGDLSAAREKASELLGVLVGSTAVCEQVRCLPLVARVLGQEAHDSLRARLPVESIPAAFRPRYREADGLITKDARALAEASQLYATLRLPYDEARSRMLAGDADGCSAVLQTLDAPLPEHWRPVWGS